MFIGNSQPFEDWTLSQWIGAVGGILYHQIASEAYGINEQIKLFDDPNDVSWSTSTVGDWVKGGIPKRKNALLVIAVLRKTARRNKRDYFTNSNIRAQAFIFLRSAACSQKFAELGDEEVDLICGDHIPEETPNNHPELYDLVQPPPPNRWEKFFGRDGDLNRTMQALNDNPVTVISGVAGEGKTSLAWFAALEASQSELCPYFDWITDKRHVVDKEGKPRNLRNKPLDFKGILKSLVRRFRWHELTGIQDVDELKNRCGEMLRQGRYLVIIDNLETLDDSEEIVNYFLGMLASKGRLAPLTSRILVTTRVQLTNNYCVPIDIHGIDQEARNDYLAFLTHSENTSLSTPQKTKLGELTDGNPLFMIIAVHRYAINPSPQTFDEIVDNLEGGIRSHFDRAFDGLFGSLASSLGPNATWIAQHAAYLSQDQPIRGADLRRQWLIYCEKHLRESQMTCLNAYDEALGQLVRHRILNRLGESGQYNMHSLIRAYFLRDSLDD
ncbi:MAG: hypothetical protein HY862_13840 [Chloroflexi bacterium]|nr:hypothetical protein [Chloroflexota bacterium]